MDEPVGTLPKATAQQPRGRRPDDHKIRIVVGSELHQTSWDRGRLMDNNRYVEISRQVADHALK